MSTEEFISIVYKNLQGDLSSDEFKKLNEVTSTNSKLANLRVEIEDAWDVSGIEQSIVNPHETEKLIEKITAPKTTATIFTLKKIITGIAALFVLAMGSIRLMQNQSTVYTEEGIYTLADNSTVELRAGSRLEVNSFTEAARNVSLKGEAYFQISKDRARPFTVFTDNSKIEVLGTSFLVKEASGFVFVDLTEGKVKFSGKRMPSESLVMTRGMKASYDDDNGLKEVEYPNLLAWKNGIYQYQDQSLNDIVSELSLLFETEIRVLDDQLLNCRLSAILTAENLDDILKQLAGQLEMNAKKDVQGWVLSGGKCK